MKNIISILSLIIFVSCDIQESNSLGSLLITANVEVCEFWIYNESEEQISHAIYDKQEARFFNISMTEKGTFTIHAVYRDTSINQTFNYDRGIYEYCIEF